MCIKDMLFVVSLPFKMLTWTRLDANRSDISSGVNPTTANEIDRTALQPTHEPGQRSLSIVVQPTSICHSIYDDCMSCHPTFVRLSSSSSVSDSARQSSAAVSRNSSWTSDGHQHVIDDKISNKRQSYVAYKKRSLGEIDITASIEPTRVMSCDRYVRSHGDHGDGQLNDHQGSSVSSSPSDLTSQHQLTYDDDVSNVSFFTSQSSPRSDKRRNDDEMSHSSPRSDKRRDDNETSHSSPRSDKKRDDDETSHSSPRSDKKRDDNETSHSSLRSDKRRDDDETSRSSPRSDQRRDDDEASRQFLQSTCLVTDDVRVSSAAQVYSNYSETGEPHCCTVSVAAETRVLSLMLPDSTHTDTCQTKPSQISNTIQTEHCIEKYRDIVGETESCFKDTSMSKALYVKRVVKEIVETEKTYVRDLGHIIQGYLGHLVSIQVASISQEDIRCLFGNIKYIRDFNSQFLVELERCFDDPVEVAKRFVEQTEGFVIYSEYCSNYPRSMEVLTRCMKDSVISTLLKRQQMVLGHGLPLGSYLLKPVQRILKYHLLLQNILDNYDQGKYGHDVIQRALDGMVNVAIRINEMKRQHERTVRVQEIQSRLYGWHGDDLTTLGDLILEDKFRMSGARERRQIFLFNTALFIAKKKSDGSLMVKAFVECSNLMLIETVVKQPLSFQIVPFDTPRIQFTVQANKIEQKRLWCQHIRRLIVNEYRDTTQLLMTSAIRHKRKDSTLDRLVKRRRRKLTGISFGNPNFDLTLPTSDVHQMSSTSCQQPTETHFTPVSPVDGATERTHTNNNEEPSHFVNDTMVDEEIFPWPIPDLLNHGKTVHSQSRDDSNMKTPVVSTLDDQDSCLHGNGCNSEASEASNYTSTLPVAPQSVTSQDTSTAASNVSDDLDNNMSVTLDPKTLSLERPSTLRRRDSIALRKSKLRQTIVGGAVLHRHYSVRSHSQVYGQGLRYPLTKEVCTLSTTETKQSKNT